MPPAAATGREIGRFEGHLGTVYGVAVSPDGELLATAGRDGTVRSRRCRS
ncbi:MAG TPA: WD40 repeat domain-containing protein [Thermoanaerobaculia bacterium]|nr:WD40 repeat domain-containing protein [Thermoanaerobaculia bacterium]